MDLRLAMPGDELAVANVHVRSWREAYVGLLPASVLQNLDPVRRAARYTFGSDNPATVVAVEDGKVCGFTTSGDARDDDAAGCGELMAIYLDPAFLSLGVGRALIADARGRLAARLFDAAVLWVMDGNERAMRFYERDGWRRDGAQRHIEIGGVTVGETRYRRDISSRRREWPPTASPTSPAANPIKASTPPYFNE